MKNIILKYLSPAGCLSRPVGGRGVEGGALAVLLILATVQTALPQSFTIQNVSPWAQSQGGTTPLVGNLQFTYSIGQPLMAAYSSLINNLAVTPGFQGPIRPLPPVLPDSTYTVCADSAYTFYFNHICGKGGNEVQWALNANFDGAHTVGYLDTISIAIGVYSTDTVWFRTVDTDDKTLSVAVFAVLTVNIKPLPPTPPAPQTVCGDTAVTFNFDSIIVGSLGNKIEWATNNGFLPTQFAASPANIALMLGGGSNTTIWLRSIDTVSGCTSGSVSTRATVSILPFPITPTASMDTICPNNSVTISVPNSQAGKSYTLYSDTTYINIGYGTGFTANLNSGNLAVTANFTVVATDTLTGCSIQLVPTINITVDSVLSAPAFASGDTLLYYTETSQYIAQNLGDSVLRYFIDTGNAKIDSASGWVSDVNSSFIVGVATMAVAGCRVADAYMPVTYIPVPGPPTPPQPQSAWSDTAVTFHLGNITAGIGGDEIEWAFNSSFTSSTIISSPGQITITVDTGQTDSIWFRTIDSKSGLKSNSVTSYLKDYHIAGSPGVSSNPVSYITLPTSTSINQSNPVGTTPGYNSITQSGGLSYTIPIVCPPGVNNLAPKISLTYNSQAGNGPMGWGWGISGLSTISRAGLDYFHDGKVTPITLKSTGDGTGTIDAFNIDGTRLTLLSGTNGADGAVYAKEVDDFSVITAVGSWENGPGFFTVATKDGITMWYGATTDSRFMGTGNNILQWRLNLVYDQNGNYILYKYDNTGGGCRIVEIDYTGNPFQGTAPYCSILFNYNQRFDANTTYTAGTPAANQYLLTNISITNANGGNGFFKQYSLNYTKDDLSSYLASVTEYGTDGSNLNSTVFRYGTSPSISNYQVTSSAFDTKWNPTALASYGADDNSGKPYFNTNTATQAEISGDFNGDGYSDMLVLYQATSPDGIADGATSPYNLAFSVNFMDPATHDFDKKDEVDKSRTDIAFTPSASGNIWGGTGYAMYHGNYRYYVGDFYGTGRDAILEVQTYDGDDGGLNLDAITCYTYDNAGNRTMTSFPLPSGQPEVGQFISIGDFDGDGRLDYVTATENGLYISFPGKGSDYFNIPLVGDIRNYDYLSAVYVIDFDGDGKKDLMMVMDDNTYIYAYSDNGAGSDSFNLVATLSYPTLNGNDQIYVGDFNGDGKTDILTHQTNTSSTPTQIPLPTNWYSNYTFTPALAPAAGSTQTDDVWNVGYSTGKVFNSQLFVENKFVINSGGGDYGYYSSTGSAQVNFATQEEYETNFAATQEFIVADFNGDGRSDILFNSVPISAGGYNVGPFGNTCSLNSKMYYSQGNQFVPYSLPAMQAGATSVVGDFNGDGRSDVAYYQVPSGCAPSAYSLDDNPSDDYYQYCFNPFYQERLLQLVSDGFNQVTAFTYKPLTDPSVHTEGNTFGYPVHSFQKPIYALNTVITPDGIGSSNVTTYTYTNALVHQRGRGFLGFQTITSNATPLNTTNVVNLDFGSPYYAPNCITKTAYVGGTEVSRVKELYNQDYLGAANHYTVQKYYEFSSNLLAGTYTTTTYSYDSYNNLWVKNTNVNGIENTSVITNYGQYGTPVPSKPTSVFTQKTRSGANEYTNTIIYHYDGFGRMIFKNTESVQGCGITYTLGYDGFGNLNEQISDVVTSTDATRYQYFTYDSYGRRPQYIQNALGQITFVQYDYNWGKPLSALGVDNNSITISYDAYGREANITPPRGNSAAITTTYAWDINNSNSHSIYSITTLRPNLPTVKVWKDAFGREVMRQTMGFSSNWLTSSVSYTSTGKQSEVIKPHYSSETSPSFSEYSYDYLNRLTEITDQFSSSTGKTTKICYEYSNGNLSTKTTPQSDQPSTQTTDATGKIISAKDNGGTLSYKYDSYGNQVQVKNNGVPVLTTTYDVCNHKTSETGPNSSGYSYQFDGYGQLIYQTDPSGNTYQMQYDVAGRLTQRVASLEGTTTYSYVRSGTWGVNKIQTVTEVSAMPGFTGVNQSYTYDVYSEMESETENINGVNYITSYSYDNITGQNTSTVYPSTTGTDNIEIDNHYDANGYLSSMSDKNTGNTLYTVNAMDGYGQATNYSLADGTTTNITTNFGVPTAYTNPYWMSLTLSYDWGTGDLLSRQDIFGNTETFTYDDNDRLTSSEVNGVTATLMNFNFVTNGDIYEKTDVGGEYTVSANAVTQVPNLAGNISENTQNITYIGCNKASEISENNYDLQYTYDANYTRKYAIMKNAGGGGSTVYTRVYSGNYELNDDQSGNPQQIHYIYGNNRLVAMIVKDNSGINEYSVYTDNLGSISVVTGGDLILPIVTNYDAWGRNRDPVNLTYPSTPYTFPSWFYRGYCGHEMLPQFGLINMNGRLYDPLLGRMLSPDNGVQFPTATQSYNAYSYCLNNPLKYTDPTGWEEDDADPSTDNSFDALATLLNLDGLDNMWSFDFSLGGDFGMGLAANGGETGSNSDGSFTGTLGLSGEGVNNDNSNFGADVNLAQVTIYGFPNTDLQYGTGDNDYDRVWVFDKTLQVWIQQFSDANVVTSKSPPTGADLFALDMDNASLGAVIPTMLKMASTQNMMVKVLGEAPKFLTDLGGASDVLGKMTGGLSLVIQGGVILNKLRNGEPVSVGQVAGVLVGGTLFTVGLFTGASEGMFVVSAVYGIAEAASQEITGENLESNIVGNSNVVSIFSH